MESRLIRVATIDLVEDGVAVIPDVEVRLHLAVGVDGEDGPGFEIESIELADLSRPGSWVTARLLAPAIRQAVHSQLAETLECDIEERIAEDAGSGIRAHPLRHRTGRPLLSRYPIRI